MPAHARQLPANCFRVTHPVRSCLASFPSLLLIHGPSVPTPAEVGSRCCCACCLVHMVVGSVRPLTRGRLSKPVFNALGIETLPQAGADLQCLCTALASRFKRLSLM